MPPRRNARLLERYYASDLSCCFSTAGQSSIKMAIISQRYISDEAAALLRDGAGRQFLVFDIASLISAFRYCAHGGFFDAIHAISHIAALR